MPQTKLAKVNRMGRRRFARRRGYVLRKYVRYRAKTGTGYLKLIRKLPEIAVTNTSVGTVSLTDPTASCVTISNLGLSLGASANMYDIAFSCKFRLDQIINSGDVTGFADKYRIKGAYIRVYYNNSNSSTGTMGGMPFIQYITDHDDAIVPTSVNSLREKMGVKFKTFNNASSYVGIKVNPRPTRNVFATGVYTGYEIPSKSLWLDCGNPNVEHYGVKGIISQMYLPSPTVANSMIKFDISVVLEAKDFQ